jgi:LmbE family N-acetylglucosaminyl deacetylase
MLALSPRPGPLAILCLGAHCDDIEIGAGGTLLRLLAERPGSSVHFVVFSSNAEREVEERAIAAEILASAGEAHVEIHKFRESFFPHEAAAIKEQFEKLKPVKPDVIFTHRTSDLHQDHRTLGELTWNTFRDHLILEYEIAKYEGDLGQPSVFVPLPKAIALRKTDLLMKHYGSQAPRRWFKAENFEALMRIRGIECNAAEGFAEAFHARKIVL